jgi:hypothetical protein
MFFVWYIKMALILGTWNVENSHLEIYRFYVSTYFVGVLKMHFSLLCMRFLPTAPIHIECYNVSLLTVWRLWNVFFIWNMISIRVPLICFISYLHLNFDQLTRIYSVTCMFIVWYINMFLNLRTCRVEKTYWKFPGLMSTDFGSVLKTHFG